MCRPKCQSWADTRSALDLIKNDKRVNEEEGILSLGVRPLQVFRGLTPKTFPQCYDFLLRVIFWNLFFSSFYLYVIFFFIVLIFVFFFFIGFFSPLKFIYIKNSSV